MLNVLWMSKENFEKCGTLKSGHWLKKAKSFMDELSHPMVPKVKDERMFQINAKVFLLTNISWTAYLCVKL